MNKERIGYKILEWERDLFPYFHTNYKLRGILYSRIHLELDIILNKQLLKIKRNLRNDTINT